MDNYFDQHNIPLDRRIATALSKLSTAIKQKAWHEAMPQRLTPTQGQVLTLLCNRPGLGLAQVAAALGIRPPTASDAVRVLEQKGLVAKSRRPDDARALALNLTADGLATAEQAQSWPDFLLPAIAKLPETQRQAFWQTLLSLITTLQDQGEIPISSMCVTCSFFRAGVHDDPRRPHHCALVDAPFGDKDLRLDCPDHQPADGSVSTRPS